MPRPIVRPILNCLLLSGFLCGAGALPVKATQIPWCMRVVPSGEIVIWYGESWCK